MWENIAFPACGCSTPARQSKVYVRGFESSFELRQICTTSKGSYEVLYTNDILLDT